MSRLDSDDLFDSVEGAFESPIEAQTTPETPAQPQVAPQRPRTFGKRPFDIYAFSLIISFVLLTAAAIMLFVDASNY
ncbi:MAG: hypothetical protein KF851_17305 [Pirellulaceae bacterium]|jgi:hypothetical protein|nr:hypothetical protein [Pirellulaceae bacterium]